MTAATQVRPPLLAVDGEPLVFPLMTAAEASAHVGGYIPAKTFLQYAREGRVACQPVGKRVLFNRPSIERAVAEGRL